MTAGSNGLKDFNNGADCWITILLYIMFLLYVGILPVWNMLVAMNYAPFINMAYFILAGIVVVLCYKVVSMFNNNQKFLMPSLGYWVGLFVISYVLLIQIVSFPVLFDMGTQEAVLYRKRFVSTAVMSLMFFLVGVNIVKIYKLLQQRLWKNVTILAYATYLVVIAYSIGTSRDGLSFLSFHLDMHLFENYLQISDGLAVLSMILICMVFRNPTVRWLLFIISLCFLYATLSRSAFYFFIIAMIVFLAITSLNKRTMVVCVTLVAFVVFGLNEIIMEFGNYRIFKVITDLSSDSSYMARQTLLMLGLQDLKDNWFLGMFMAELASGRYGGYIHNYLSFWLSYGLIPFVGFIFSSISGFVLSFRKLLTNRNNDLLGFVVTYGIYCFLAIALTKSYGWPYVWLILPAAHQAVRYFKHVQD